MNQSNYSARISKLEMNQALDKWNSRVKDAKIKKLEKANSKMKSRIFELEFEMAEIMVTVQEIKTRKSVSDTKSVIKKLFGGKND